MPEVKELVDSGKYYLVQSPMCRFGMKLKDDNGEEQYVRKETLWLTNSEAIANELKGVCDNVLHGQEIHRHVKLIGGQRAKAAQVYPKALVEAILRGLQKEVRRAKKISMVEEMIRAHRLMMQSNGTWRLRGQSQSSMMPREPFWTQRQ